MTPELSGQNAGREIIPFRRAIEDELAAIEKSRRLLLVSDRSNPLHGIILICCFLVNALFLLVRRDYFALFIAASFYLNMFYFISLLVPTSREYAGIHRGDLRKFLSWLHGIGIKAGTTRFTRLFLNAFFINSRALSLGIGLIFTTDIIFTLIAFLVLHVSVSGTLIVLSQCTIIAVFYFLIWKIEPFSDTFAKNVEGVRALLSDNKVPPLVISALFMVAFAFAVILILITIILLPGITVATFLTESGLAVLGHLVGLIAILAVSQYFIIRYIHGSGSRLVALRLLDHKEDTLRELLVEDRDGPADPAKNPYETTTRLLESKIYQVKQNTLLGTFPVYVVDLDLSVMLDSTTMTAIQGYIQKKGS
ncbi:hypothetical protein [uncultured Methanoregula sp.]|uniref:hypothetical protein n=1 Tax=uncultured Methanoregula sp. TaxID=1005933 RepID=UPI002AAA813B|nr:hypothetical protein [uncultured Methanoregula sp.]